MSSEWAQQPSGLMLPERPPEDEGYELSESGLLVPRRMRRRYTAVDLFCGCGGFSLGLLAAGWHIVAAADNDCDATLTYLVNLGAFPVDLRFVTQEDRERFEDHLERGLRKSRKGGRIVYDMEHVSGSNRQPGYGPPGWDGVPVFWFGDVSKLSGAELLEPTGIAPGALDLVVGGPPCQGFSYMGKRDEQDARNSLVFEFARLVCEMRPRTMCMENVPGILDMRMPDGALVVDELTRILERGDFGEFEAMRKILTGERRSIRRGAGKKKRSKGPKRKRGHRVAEPAEGEDVPEAAE